MYWKNNWGILKLAVGNTGRFNEIADTHFKYFSETQSISKENFLAQKVSMRIKQMMNSYVSEIDYVIDMVNSNMDSYNLSKKISLLKHLSRSQNVAVKKLLEHLGRLS